jgi:antitoxin (DNA-binding transcriptional repressor) of toxin-antitoxin stability system
MKTINMHEAKTNLSKLVRMGEPFLIAKAGKPVFMATPLQEKKSTRIGFMEGQFTVPEDFDHMMQDEIAEMFGV